MVDNISDIKRTLELFGVCVVRNVIPNKQCNRIFNEMVWDFERRTANLDKPFNLTRVNTWDTLDQFYPLHHMMYKHWGLGHSQYLWDHVRTNAGIINCFEQIWNTRQLITSFDGISFHLPHELSKKNHYAESEKEWYHFDQSLLKPNFDCVQGIVNFMDTNEGDATLLGGLLKY